MFPCDVAGGRRELLRTRPELAGLPPAERWRLSNALFAELLPATTAPRLLDVIGQKAAACLDERIVRDLILTVRLECAMVEVRRTYCDQCGHKSGFTRFCPGCGKPGTDRPYTPSALRPGYCPGCGEEYTTVTSKYCSVCGVPRSGDALDNTEAYCCSCGRPILTASAEYCAHCGGKVLYR